MLPTIPPLALARPDVQAARLRKLGFAVDATVPGYRLKDVIRRFQMAHLTPNGQPLAIDGEYGPETEAALFSTYIPKGSSLIERVIAVASSQVGITEVPPGSNKGPQIDLVLKAVGLGSGYPWCAAFVYWCFQQACRQMDVKNPCPKNAGVLNMWNLAGYAESGLTRITAEQARKNPKLIKPGMQFILKLGPEAGHTGLIIAVLANGTLITIEGNSNSGGSREGIAVTRLTRRTISSINHGFVVYPA